MNIIVRFFLGLGIAGIGVLIVMYTNALIDFGGTSGWAEQKLGGGGTRLLYKLAGVGIILIGFAVAVGLWNSIMETLFRIFIPTGT